MHQSAGAAAAAAIGAAGVHAGVAVIIIIVLQSSGSVKSLAKSVSEVSLKESDSKANLVQDQSPRTVTGGCAGREWKEQVGVGEGERGRESVRQIGRQAGRQAVRQSCGHAARPGK